MLTYWLCMTFPRKHSLWVELEWSWQLVYTIQQQSPSKNRKGCCVLGSWSWHAAILILTPLQIDKSIHWYFCHPLYLYPVPLLFFFFLITYKCQYLTYTYTLTPLYGGTSKSEIKNYLKTASRPYFQPPFQLWHNQNACFTNLCFLHLANRFGSAFWMLFWTWFHLL